jgi:hypothetical protein
MAPLVVTLCWIFLRMEDGQPGWYLVYGVQSTRTRAEKRISLLDGCRGAMASGMKKVKKASFHCEKGGKIEIWNSPLIGPPLVPRALPGTVSLLLLSPR